MSIKSEFDRVLQRVGDGKEPVDYGIMDGDSTVLLVKSGNGGSYRGYEDKYLRLANRVNRGYGYTVICASNPVHGDKTLESDMCQVKDYADLRGFDRYHILYMGFSDGARIGACHGADHPEICRMVLLNCPLMINWHKTKAGILRFSGEQSTFVFGSLDPSCRYAELIRTLEKENPRIRLEIVAGQDHHFSKDECDLAGLAEKYLL